MSLLLERRAEILNRLPMVRWDRCVRWKQNRPDEPECMFAFGWIDRDDGRSDFAMVEFLWPDEPLLCSAATSSAEHSREIQIRLHGEGADHVDCERITEALPGLLDNVVGQGPEPGA